MELEAATVGTYLRRVLDGMAQTLDRFDDESVNRRPHGPQTNSAAMLVVHACSAATYWLENVGLGRPVARDRDREFEASATVDELQAVVATTTDRLLRLSRDFDAGPTVPDHEWRDTLYGDPSDGSLILHVFEELFQHLGHLELTADAVARPS